MIKVFVETGSLMQDEVEIVGADARHLRLVLRKVVGDSILVGIGGATYRSTILSVLDDVVIARLDLLIASKGESPLKTRLYQGLAKGDKFDLVVQKATELGVTEITPFTSQYTVVQLEQKKQERRQLRWQKIAHEAAKQCKRDKIPKVNAIIDFSTMVTQLQAMDSQDMILMPYEQASDECHFCPFSKAPREVGLIIGPEGGFHPGEVERVREIGGQVISLGSRILRTETAALVALTLVQYQWGDLAFQEERVTT